LLYACNGLICELRLSSVARTAEQQAADDNWLRNNSLCYVVGDYEHRPLYIMQGYRRLTDEAATEPQTYRRVTSAASCEAQGYRRLTAAAGYIAQTVRALTRRAIAVTVKLRNHAVTVRMPNRAITLRMRTKP
jgi:hypothetical protein